MDRWHAVETRDSLSEEEHRHLLQVVDSVCGPRPAGTRTDAAVSSWNWAKRWIMAMSEHELRKRETPARRQEIEEIVTRYESSAFD